MKGVVSVLVCLAALILQSRGQVFQGTHHGAHGGVGHGGQGHGHHGHGMTNASTPRKCPKFWLPEGDSCYLYDSGAFMRGVVANTTIMIGNQDGLFQAAANDYCMREDPRATLVTVNNLQENNFLYEWAVRMVVEPVPIWIGLHVGPTGLWQWYNGEPVNFQNWDPTQLPIVAEPGLGAVIFDADIQNQIYNNQVEITPQWVPEMGRNEPHALICEIHPAGMTAGGQVPTSPSTTQASSTAPPTTANPTTAAPATTRRPVKLRNRPANVKGAHSFGGSGLFEVLRGQGNRPANYRMNPYYAIQP